MLPNFLCQCDNSVIFLYVSMSFSHASHLLSNYDIHFT